MAQESAGKCGQKRPDNFWYIFLIKASFEKYLKEKCLSDHKQQLPFNYFSKYCFNLKLFSKVSKFQTTLLWMHSGHEWVKDYLTYPNLCWMGVCQEQPTLLDVSY